MAETLRWLAAEMCWSSCGEGPRGQAIVCAAIRGVCRGASLGGGNPLSIYCGVQLLQCCYCTACVAALLLESSCMPLRTGLVYQQGCPIQQSYL